MQDFIGNPCHIFMPEILHLLVPKSELTQKIGNGSGFEAIAGNVAGKGVIVDQMRRFHPEIAFVGGGRDVFYGFVKGYFQRMPQIKAIAGSNSEPVTRANLPAGTPKILIGPKTIWGKVTPPMKHSIPRQKLSNIHKIRMNKGIGIDVDVPVIPPPKGVNLKFLVHHRPGGKLPFGDDIDLVAAFLGPLVEEWPG